MQLRGLSRTFCRAAAAEQRAPMRVALTGSSGNIGYATLFRLASGDVFGRDQPLILHLYDIPQMLPALRGTLMELEDIASPLLRDVVVTDDLRTAFRDVDLALLIGSKPRGPGMERADLLKENGKIFVEQGKALEAAAKRTTRVLVVGNPANTNCMILARHAPSIPHEGFNAMTRLDHDRGVAMLARKLGCAVEEVERFCVWGNHSPTMFPDVANVHVGGRPAELPSQWVADTFTPGVQTRGAKVIEARKSSSAGSAANAALAHCRDWFAGTRGRWTSASMLSEGQYGVAPGLVFSFPVTGEGGRWKLVEGLSLSEEARRRLKTTQDELVKEREAVQALLG